MPRRLRIPRDADIRGQLGDGTDSEWTHNKTAWKIARRTIFTGTNEGEIPQYFRILAAVTGSGYGEARLYYTFPENPETGYVIGSLTIDSEEYAVFSTNQIINLPATEVSLELQARCVTCNKIQICEFHLAY